MTTREGRQGYGSLHITVGQGLSTAMSARLLIQPRSAFLEKSIASANEAGKEVDMWQLELFAERNTLQIVHSVSGEVVIKHFKQLSFFFFSLSLRLSSRSCEVKCTVSECELQTFFSFWITTNHHHNGTLTVSDKSFIPLPPRSFHNYHEHKSYHRGFSGFVSHNLKDKWDDGPEQHAGCLFFFFFSR